MTVPQDWARRVSVVVITHNRREQLARTVQRMLGSAQGARIIVVDNASDDGTAEMVGEHFPSIDLIVEPSNAGAVGRNHAVARVRTPYVAFCDDDTVWTEGALARGVALLDSYSGLATVTGRCLVAPDMHEDPITPEVRYSPIPRPDWMPGPALLSVMAGLTMIRTAAFREVGGFCEKYWLGGEEELLSLDLAERGWWMMWDEDMVIEHQPSAQRDATRRRQLGIRNTLWTLWLRRPAVHALTRSARIVGSAPRDSTTAMAVVEALRGLPWVMRRRHVVGDGLEHGLRMLEKEQDASPARRYVG